MDLMSDEAIGAFGVLVTEAITRLVDAHDESLDKRAAMLKVESPTFLGMGSQLRFEFKVSGNREPTALVGIELVPEENDEDDRPFDGTPFFAALRAVPVCSCASFKRDARCSHTLSVSWWLQEQMARHGVSGVFELFHEMQADPVGLGRELAETLLALAEEAGSYRAAATTRLQWRIGLSDSRYYSPITITPYEQRPRKNGKGWTKGREVRSYDLLKRDFHEQPIDGEIAALTSTPSYSFEENHFAEFRALQRLVGHPNVAWDDGDATSVAVFSGELTLALKPVELDSDESDPDAETATRFRPQLQVSGIDVDPQQCEVMLGHASPVEPIIILVDLDLDRIVVCSLRDRRGTRLLQFLLQSDMSEVLLDQETAAKVSVAGVKVDPLVRMELPQELAGPIEPTSSELVFELRPRPGAGIHVALMIHDDRFREVHSPGAHPEIVPCLTEQGPVRLQRDLRAERSQAEQVVERFELQRLEPDGDFRWLALSDDAALDLLARLYQGGDSTPRLIWPEGETIRVRGEISPAALRVQIDDRKDWFGLSGVVKLDGKEVKLADLLVAVREKRALVQVGDREFARISDAFRRRLQQLGDAVIAERGSLKVAEAEYRRFKI